MKIKNLGFIGFPKYEISDEGVVYSLDYRKSGKRHPLIASLNTKGYSQVRLRSKEGNLVARVHRLVALAFIPNPLALPQVNHKDECKTNNRVGNLEWCDNSYNMKYGMGAARRSAAQKGKPKISLQKKVEQLTMQGEHVAFFDSTRIAVRETRIWSVSKACCGAAKTAGGYKWRYV